MKYLQCSMGWKRRLKVSAGSISQMEDGRPSYRWQDYEDGSKSSYAVVLLSMLPSDQRERSPLSPLPLRSPLPSDQRERSPISPLVFRSAFTHLFFRELTHSSHHIWWIPPNSVGCHGVFLDTLKKIVINITLLESIAFL
jgi:hypothetical protein